MATNSSSFPENWIDLFQSDQPLDMDAFLQSDLFAAKRNAYMEESIANMLSGSISFIASMLLVIYILRSHDRLSTTYHRLIFGLSAADIISSFGFALSSTMSPKEMSYLVPFARGNIATCDAQGYLINFAVTISVGYNCSICFYYLAIITYNKRYDYIRKKLEPWFHGISISSSLVSSVILLVTNTFNGPSGGHCFMEPHAPPHCIGYQAGYIPKGYSIPCWRGGENYGQAELRTIVRSGGLLLALIIAPVIIVVTMGSMFRSVSRIEKQMQNYGVGALRFRTIPAAPTNTTSPDQQEGSYFLIKMKKLGKYLCLTADASQTNDGLAVCCFRRPRQSRATKSNKMKSQKRAILHMAFGYAGAWLLVWTPFFVYSMFLFVHNFVPDAVVILSNFMTPLQGFFNFVVFMAPKVRTTRLMAMQRGRKGSRNLNSQSQHLTWRQAFSEAYMSRGPARRI
jgi:hypothetical protein